MVTAILDTCTRNSDELIPLISNMKDDATAKAPVPNKSKWYCIPGNIMLINIPRRFTKKMTILYWRKGDDVAADKTEPSNKAVECILTRECGDDCCPPRGMMFHDGLFCNVKIWCWCFSTPLRYVWVVVLGRNRNDAGARDSWWWNEALNPAGPACTEESDDENTPTTGIKIFHSISMWYMFEKLTASECTVDNNSRLG